MSHSKFARLAALAAGSCLMSEVAVAENRLALVIGNSSYETVSVLPNPANDAKAVADLLNSAGFEVISAPNLTQTGMRQAISNFAGIVAGKGADTVSMVFYAGHGLQVDGENYLVPVDARIERESDVSLQGMRLADVMNTLASVPSKTRIVILDACRNNPFSEINRTGGRGLAIVDAPSGSLVSYSTAPGTEAQDGEGANSPYTAALLKIAREPGVPIEQVLKRIRSSVHGATNYQQTPWESSSLTTDFFFFPGEVAGRPAPQSGNVKQVSAAGDTQPGARGRAAARSVESWRREFRSRQPAEAYASVIEEGTPEAFEAYLAVYSVAPYAPRVRSLLDRRREMIAWYTAVTVNTVASFQEFLAAYGNSDLAATARRLMERARGRSIASLAPMCPCAQPAAPAPSEKRERKAKGKEKEKQASRPTKRSGGNRDFVSDEEVSRGAGPKPAAAAPGAPSGPPISIGIGIPMGGGGFGRGGGGGYRAPASTPMGGQHSR